MIMTREKTNHDLLQVILNAVAATWLIMAFLNFDHSHIMLELTQLGIWFRFTHYEGGLQYFSPGRISFIKPPMKTE